MKKSEALKLLDRALVECDTPERLLEFIERNLYYRAPSYEGLAATGEKWDKNNPDHQARDTWCFNEWEPEDGI
jgi:hypothetical protein